MVSISNVSSGQAETYYQKDNYYTQERGEWHGKGAATLELSGEVDEKTFTELSAGYAKGSLSDEEYKKLKQLLKEENKLHNACKKIENMKDEDAKREKLQAIQGEIKQYNRRRAGFNRNHKDGKMIKDAHDKYGIMSHRAGVDMTFSAPKSVSVASEVLQDERVREAHERAVKATLDYAERNYAQARQTTDGETEKVNTGNFTVALFSHNLSRELDPQLHTHGVLFNMTMTEKGWRAVSNEELYKYKMFLGQHYRNELSKNLKDLGYEIEKTGKGFFELKGIDNDLRESFSRRAEQIDAKVKELKNSGKYKGASEQKLREYACLDSRATKKDVNIEAIRGEWKERAERQGYDLDKLKTELKAQKQEMHDYNYTADDYVREAAQAQTQNESTFSREDTLKTAGQQALGELRIGDLEQSFDSAVRKGEIRRLDSLDTDTFTTPEMLRIENEMIDKMRVGKGAVKPLGTVEEVESFMKSFEERNGFAFTPGQRRALQHFATSPDRYMGIQGDAGTGKTTVMKAFREFAAEKGFTLRGITPTGKAGAELQGASSIESTTFDGFMNTVNSTNFHKNREFWLCDEASMMGSARTLQMLKTAEAHGARVGFIGDEKQLQAIDAGRAFKAMQEYGDMKAVRMPDIQRQKDMEYRKLAKEFSEKQLDTAIRELEDKGWLREIKDREERLNAIKDEFIKDPYNSVGVTALNEDKTDLNNKIRQALKEANKLGAEYNFTVREPLNLNSLDKRSAFSYKVNDVVVPRKEGAALRKAGTEWRVKDIDKDKNTLKLENKTVGNVKQVEIDLRKHGDNLSTYREQVKAFAVGDKVNMLKNDKGIGVQNGQTATIERIGKEGRATLKMESGEIRRFSFTKQYNYLDYGYAVTTYKSQGMNAKNAYYHADTSKGVNYNQAYVGITRGKQKLRVFTDDKEAFKEQFKREQKKAFTMDHAEKTETGKAEPARYKQPSLERSQSQPQSQPKSVEVETGKNEKSIGQHQPKTVGTEQSKSHQSEQMKTERPGYSETQNKSDKQMQAPRQAEHYQPKQAKHQDYSKSQPQKQTESLDRENSKSQSQNQPDKQPSRLEQTLERLEKAFKETAEAKYKSQPQPQYQAQMENLKVKQMQTPNYSKPQGTEKSETKEKAIPQTTEMEQSKSQKSQPQSVEKSSQPQTTEMEKEAGSQPAKPQPSEIER